MKSEKGITLVALMITIIVILIIAGVATYSGMESVDTAKRTAFISEMEMIQAKVNIIYEKRKTNEQDLEYYNNLGQDISKVSENKLNTALGGTSRRRV